MTRDRSPVWPIRACAGCDGTGRATPDELPDGTWPPFSAWDVCADCDGGGVACR